jgi:hypothetical protein
MLEKTNPKLNENEEIKLCILQHWIIPLRSVISCLIFLGTSILIFFGGYLSLNNFEILAKSAIWLSYISGLVSIHWFVIMIFKYLNSRTYITNMRVINFNAIPMIADDITYILIDEIHEIEEHKQGFMRNILNYGDISVNLPAMPNAIDLSYIHHPEKIVDFVEKIRRERKTQNKG